MDPRPASQVAMARVGIPIASMISDVPRAWAFVTTGPVSRSGTKNVAPAASALAIAAARMSPPAGRANETGRGMAVSSVAVSVLDHTAPRSGSVS